MSGLGVILDYESSDGDMNSWSSGGELDVDEDTEKRKNWWRLMIQDVTIRI